MGRGKTLEKASYQHRTSIDERNQIIELVKNKPVNISFNTFCKTLNRNPKTVSSWMNPKATSIIDQDLGNENTSLESEIALEDDYNSYGISKSRVIYS